jgi:hypothetical protein
MNTPDIPFEAWPKIPRLAKDIVITEKLDGTNAQVYVELTHGVVAEGRAAEGATLVEMSDGTWMTVYAGSRKRWITPERDNYGFATWVEANALTLAKDLGPGHHFGEWWGAGIQRRYDQLVKRWSLFNVYRFGPHTERKDPRCAEGCKVNPKTGQKWCGCRPARDAVEFSTPNVDVVPVLYDGPFTPGSVLDPYPWDQAIHDLQEGGSVAAPGFMDPEGIVVYHTAAGHPFKYVISGEGDKRSG